MMRLFSCWFQPTNSDLCKANPKWSESFAARIISAFCDSDALSCLTVYLENEMNCAAKVIECLLTTLLPIGSKSNDGIIS